MYQSVHYSFRNRKYYLKDDETPGWSEFEYNHQIYEKIDKFREGALPTLFGEWCVPTSRFDKEDQNLLGTDLKKEFALLRDLYYENDDSVPKWHNKVYLDIEIEMGGALTPEYIKAAPMPITSIALTDKTTNQNHCWIVDKKGEIENSEIDNQFIYSCSSEKDLVIKFLEKWAEIECTILVTWNGAFFDIPYLYYRLLNNWGVAFANALSPLKEVNVKMYDQKNPIQIAGISHLDYFLIFKNFITKQEASYKLGDIGFKYVDLGKIEYEGNLNTLFKQDPKKFIEYNMRDVEILDKLDDKLQFIDLTILICSMCCVPYESIYYNTHTNEGAVLKYLKRKGIVPPNKPNKINTELSSVAESYAGGYLKEPIPGLYDWVIDLDFTSLYPSIIKSLNLGVETLVGRIRTPDNFVQTNSLEYLKGRNEDEELIIDMFDSETYTLNEKKTTVGEFINTITDNNFSLAASGGFFRNDIESITCTILKDWFEKRKYFNNLKKKAIKEKNEDEKKFYHQRQHAMKILQNGLYGTYSLSSWRFSDGNKICSAAITNTGQRLTQDSIKYTNDLINEMTGGNDDHIVASDTDSLFIKTKLYLESKFPGIDFNDRELVTPKVLEFAKHVQDKTNENLTKLSRECFNINKEHYFELKQEYIIFKCIWTGKRRYAQYLINQEGYAIEEMDFKGLEVMKSNMNKNFKVFGENLIKEILFGKPKAELDKSIQDFYKHIKTLDIKELSKPTGLRKLRGYIKSPPKNGTIFSELHKGTPVNSRSAANYNDLLKFKGYDKKYPSIIEGDRIFWVNLKNNPYKIEKIGFPNDKMPEEITNFIKTFIDIELIFESSLLEKLRNLYGDIGWSFPSLNPNTYKFFKTK